MLGGEQKQSLLIVRTPICFLKQSNSDKSRGECEVTPSMLLWLWSAHRVDACRLETHLCSLWSQCDPDHHWNWFCQLGLESIVTQFQAHLHLCFHVVLYYLYV